MSDIVRVAMKGAGTSADLALQVARDAQKVASEASGKASQIRSDSASARVRAEELSDSVRSLADKLVDTEGVVAEKENVAKVDGEAALTVPARLDLKKKTMEDKRMLSFSSFLLPFSDDNIGPLQGQPGAEQGERRCPEGGAGQEGAGGHRRHPVHGGGAGPVAAAGAGQEGGGGREAVSGAGPGPAAQGLGGGQTETGDDGEKYIEI